MEVGKTKSVGYQVGVRRTLPLTLEEAWEMIVSPRGINVWLGETSSYDFSVGANYYTREGISGEIRVLNERQNVRLTWKKEQWERASTLQIRTIEQLNGKCTISFHQENLPSTKDREEMKVRWEEVLEKLMQGI
ncbi:SRPBCC domain-containing protein [Paenibacillus lutimineralis]|uniref:SRPBCC domain-containing protein n=1 Tax=Paenibacillus lutimineralis TaxID=2707005 RepID=A0A3S9V1Z3_9BACL|nr:SRPBCC domain-containing protein [Paenibacillus lutimineralis]AZS16588.1 SRPBCC domain-containing protein [Paenibacillus lutimineralis]